MEKRTGKVRGGEGTRAKSKRGEGEKRRGDPVFFHKSDTGVCVSVCVCLSGC